MQISTLLTSYLQWLRPILQTYRTSFNKIMQDHKLHHVFWSSSIHRIFNCCLGLYDFQICHSFKISGHVHGLFVHALSQFRVFFLSKLTTCWHISDANFDCKHKKFVHVQQKIKWRFPFFYKTMKFSWIKRLKQTFEPIFLPKNGKCHQAYFYFSSHAILQRNLLLRCINAAEKKVENK